MVNFKTFEDIKDVDTNEYMERVKNITVEEAEKIREIADLYSLPNIHRPDHQALRYHVIRDAIFKNGRESKFVLKSAELALRFYDERWYEMTKDLSVSRRALAFDTTEQNVILYDGLRFCMDKVLEQHKKKSIN